VIKGHLGYDFKGVRGRGAGKMKALCWLLCFYMNWENLLNMLMYINIGCSSIIYYIMHSVV
jgi:hypothetical protein